VTSREPAERSAGVGELPVDPDATADRGAPFAGRRARPRVHLHPGVLGAIAAGGFAGGLARYGISEAAPSAVSEFPWATFAVNVSGAFGLAMLLVLAIEVWRPTRYLRPALGTGFFGAYTTWSTYMVQTDQLLSHDKAALAAAYLLGSAAAGLVAAGGGLLLARRLFLRTHPHRHEQRR
jgi:CrcB protein